MDIYSLLKRKFKDSFIDTGGDEVRVNCPKCTDTRSHFYFNVKLGLGHCKLCGYNPNLFQLLKVLAFEGKVEPVKVPRKKEVRKDVYVEFPREFRKFSYDFRIPVEFLKYIGGRKLNLEELIRKGCGYCTDGFYGGRIVMPVYEGFFLRCFVARDITGRALLKYRYPKFTKISEQLYNLEEAKKYKKCVLVEGIFDCLRVGDLGVAIFGKTLSKVQEEKLLLSRFKTAYVMLDADAGGEAWEVARKVRGLVKEVKVVELPEGDPCDYSREELEGFIKGAKTFTLKEAVLSRFSV